MHKYKHTNIQVHTCRGTDTQIYTDLFGGVFCSIPSWFRKVLVWNGSGSGRFWFGTVLVQGGWFGTVLVHDGCVSERLWLGTVLIQNSFGPRRICLGTVLVRDEFATERV